MPSALATVSAQVYLGIRKLLCPYCSVGIPDSHNSATPPVWVHAIPGTAQTFNCQAGAVRVARLADGASDA